VSDNRQIGFVLADTHGGNTLGLLSPGTIVQTEVEDGEPVDYELPLNPAQLFLDKTYTWLLDVAKQYAKDDEVLLVHDGDMTQGGKYGSLVSPSESVQVIVGVKNMQRAIDALPNCKTMRILKGTGVHVFDNGDSESMVGKLLKLTNPQLDIKVIYHNLIDFHGVTCDISHHGPPPGRRAWLEGNEARYYLRSLMMTELMAGRIPPRLVVRAHYHTYVKETISMIVEGEEIQSTIVVCPSMCLIDDHARKTVKSPYISSVGGIFFEVINGQLTDVKVKVKILDVRTKESIYDIIN
jgi:hypothetical protein